LFFVSLKRSAPGGIIISEVVILKQYVSGAIVPDRSDCWTQIPFQVKDYGFRNPGSFHVSLYASRDVSLSNPAVD
jgi:hypothetical protein